jgi:outer membrane protein TolC
LRADLLPRVDVTANYQNTDPQLSEINGVDGDGGFSTVPGQYNLSITASQIVFAGGRVISQTRSADFQRDAAYYAFRSTIDQVIATVRTHRAQLDTSFPIELRAAVRQSAPDLFPTVERQLHTGRRP